MNASDMMRVVVFVPRPLMAELREAADAAGETMPEAIRAQLASSLFPSQTAARSGVAGRGEVAAPASPELGT